MNKDIMTDVDYEIRRQKAIEKELGCEFIRITPAKENFSSFVKIGKIQNYIVKSTKKSLINEFSNKLFRLDLKKITPKNKVFKIYC